MPGTDPIHWILVHRNELFKPWQEHLRAFLALDKGHLATLGDSKRKPGGAIDIASMRSLFRGGEVSDVIERHGDVVIVENHHLAARSYEELFKAGQVHSVPGLTATPIRRDGRHPIMYADA